MNLITTTIQSPALPAEWRDFLALTKPRVMVLVVYTGLIGMLMAPVSLPPALGIAAILCIALAAGASGALNQWYEVDIDSLMKRTMKRPLPDGRMDAQSALHFGVGLSGFAVLTMGFALNWLAAGILLGSILFYVIIYTVWLKRRTPQNIVIGGAAGAFPPLIGWAAATGQISMLPVLMFALVFFWTPPHFWSLALFMEADYGAAGVPMMPNVAGERSTRRQILFYTLPMAICAIAPWALGMTGLVYGAAAIVLTAVFAALAFRVSRRTSDATMKPERQLFKYSILYLFALFGVLLLDKFI
jgi:protoheme IX farnesyltransferase